ncbi:rhomboid family intramembrane serine protease rho-7 [Megalopta genalis]|uniref:rhomboid family intramembrane serine protease rho-7 n=1 Tax=Megalopta genalis TaxID=115081 RepID=UPI001442EA10|nr:presenilins-associated rhomboid-like protein, mitochondrial [Megalopta genalis]
MAVRSVLCLGDNVCKCVFATVSFKPKLYTTNVYNQIRHFKRFQGSEKKRLSLLNEYVDKGNVSLSKMWKPFTFTVMFSGTTLIAAAIWNYENNRERTYRIINRYRQLGVQKIGWRRDMEIWWNNLTEGEKIFAPICFLNVLVFLAWRVPKFQKTMIKYFCSGSASGATCWPMLLSSFSHHSFLHLAANMYVLHSFCSLAVSALGKEQFVAFYLTSAVMSSFISNLYKTALGLSNPSLGASGAIMGVFGYACTQFPDIYLSIIFLPMYTFTANTAIKFIMGLDTMGILCRWQFFDHAAHLSGVLFGIFWKIWGSAYIWQKRESILTIWHDIRGPPRSR